MRGNASERGLLVAIEGVSGVGKTTAVATLTSSSVVGSSPLTVKLPSAGPLGTLAREFLEQGLHETVALTAAADRAFAAEVEIAPALAAGRSVIVDRYVVSALALNRLSGLAFEDSFALCARLPQPDLSVLLIGDPETISARLGRRDHLDCYERGEGPVGLSEQEALSAAVDFLETHGWRIARVDTATLGPTQAAIAIDRLITEADERL